MKQTIMTAPGKSSSKTSRSRRRDRAKCCCASTASACAGSDVHVYHGKHPYTKYPVVQGHEYSASVEAVGPGVTGLALGTKVTSMPQIVCGECGAVPARRLPHLRQTQSRRVPGAGLRRGAMGHQRGQDHPAARPLQLRAGRAGRAGLRRGACHLAGRRSGWAPRRGVGRGADRQPGGTGGPQRGRGGVDHRPERVSGWRSRRSAGWSGLRTPRKRR